MIILTLIKDIIAKVTPKVTQAVALMPFPAGLALGYFFHSEIKLALTLITSLIKVF